jgi:hypothetical protein
MAVEVSREGMMEYAVLVKVVGRELDEVRRAASQIAQQTDWWTERRPSGTAFCFDNANTRTMFSAYCAKYGIQCGQD